MLIIRRIFRIALFLFLLLNVLAAFHAYKFTHFYPEKEIDVKKPDEMNSWDKTRAVLFGVNYPKSKNTLKPYLNYSTIQLRTEDSLLIEGWHIKKKLARGTVILFHGHGSSKSKLLNEAEYMNSIGYNTLPVDFRAHGGSDGKICTIGYYEAEEVKLAFDYVSKLGEKNICLWGISMGAAAITRAISKYSLKPQQVILEMPFGSLQQAVKGRVRTMGLPQQPISMLLTFWGGVEQGFWAFNHNPADYAIDISCPVLLQWGARDARVTREEIDEIFKNLAAADKKLVVFAESKHESLCNKENVKWTREISTFLR